MKKSILNRLLSKFGFVVIREKRKAGIELANLKKIKTLRLVFGYFLFLLLVWGLYRFIFRLPESVEELILKPLIWLGYLWVVVRRREKKPLSSLGLTGKFLFRSLYWGIGLGIFFSLEGLLINYLKYGQFSFPPLSYSGGEFIMAFLISIVTAISEEVSFRGFIFNRLWQVWQDELLANFVTSILFTLMHLPITIFVLNYGFVQMVTYGLIVFVYSLGASFVFARSKNIVAPILIHVFWSWPVVLFR